MPNPLAITPLRFDPAMERPEPDEAETSRAIVETMRAISLTTFRHGGHALRSVHAKSHALLKGEIVVSGDLPPELAQGAFATPGTYPVVMRISTNPGDILDDSVSLPRGLAIKMLGVPGERLPGAGGTSQDLVMVNGPAFIAPTAKAFLGNLRILAKTTDTPQVLKKGVSALLRGVETLLEAVGGGSATLKALGGHPNTNPLGDTYYTQVPVLYGPYMAKLSVAPASASLTRLRNASVDVSERPNALRETLLEVFRETGGEWDLRVQLCTDLDRMPIEDASVVWPESVSPFVTAARIKVGPQESWSEERSREIDDSTAFSPWHGLAAHRPLGSIMRVRKPAYEMSSGFRAERNGCPIHEPAASPG